jgi:hypothetical protein
MEELPFNKSIHHFVPIKSHTSLSKTIKFLLLSLKIRIQLISSHLHSNKILPAFRNLSSFFSYRGRTLLNKCHHDSVSIKSLENFLKGYVPSLIVKEIHFDKSQHDSNPIKSNPTLSLTVKFFLFSWKSSHSINPFIIPCR